MTKSTSFSESNINVNTNTSSLTINIYFSADNQWTWFESATLYCTCNGVTQAQNVSHSIGGSVSASFRFDNIPHNTDGSKTVGWSWSCATGTSVLGTVSESGTRTLTKINRTITNSVTGTDIDAEFSVNYTKIATENYTYRLRISLPNVVMLEYKDYNTSDEPFTLSQSVIEDLYSRYTTTNTFNLGFAVETLNASGQLISEGNEVVIQARITGADPVFNDFSFEDTNAKTLALTGDSSINVNGYSNIQITISTLNKAVAQKGASMVKYRVIVGNQTIDLNYSDSEDLITTINNSTTGTYQVYAIDSRNNSTLVTKLATSVKDYAVLVRNTNFSAERDDGGTGGNVTITFSGSIWNDNFGAVTNSFKNAKYLFKKTDSSTWIDLEDLGITPTDITPTISGNNYSFTGQIRSNNEDTKWDLQSSYEIKVILEDKLSSVEFIAVLTSALPNISLSRNGVGIMCDYDETKGGLLQVGGEVYGSGITYSENEVKTKDIWINGKPIYRKVLQFTTGSTANAWTDQNHNISNLDIDTLRIVSAWVKTNETAQYVINEYVPSRTFQLGANDLNLRYAMTESKFTGKQMTVILEYTKTTD